MYFNEMSWPMLLGCGCLYGSVEHGRMNKIFRLVWNRSLRQMVVASEMAKVTQSSGRTQGGIESISADATLNDQKGYSLRRFLLSPLVLTVAAVFVTPPPRRRPGRDLRQLDGQRYSHSECPASNGQCHLYQRFF